MKKYGNYDKAKLEKVLAKMEKGFRDDPSQGLQRYNNMAIKDLSSFEKRKTPETVEEFFFGDEEKDFKLTENSFNFSKEYVQKLIY